MARHEQQTDFELRLPVDYLEADNHREAGLLILEPNRISGSDSPKFSNAVCRLPIDLLISAQAGRHLFDLLPPAKCQFDKHLPLHETGPMCHECSSNASELIIQRTVI